MIDLEHYTGAVGMKPFGELAEIGDVSVMVDPELCRAIESLHIYAGVFDRDESGTAFGSLLIVTDMILGHLAVLPAHIAAHRHHGYAVLHSHRFDCDRRKNAGVHHTPLVLLISSVSCGSTSFMSPTL